MGSSIARFGFRQSRRRVSVCLSLVAAFLAVSAFHSRDGAAEEVSDALRQQLAREYRLSSGAALPSTPAAPEAPGAGGIRFRSISARGLFRTVWVRVEIEVQGREPPDGRSVRYFRMHRSNALGQWLLDGETTALAYHLPF